MSLIQQLAEGIIEALNKISGQGSLFRTLEGFIVQNPGMAAPLLSGVGGN